MNKKNLLLVLMLTLALILRLVNLSFPPQFYFDENYSAFTAVALSRGNAPVIWKPMSQPIDPPRGYEWSHPPLTRILIAASITILGNHPWVWRLTSVLAGVGTTLIIYLIGKALFSKTVGLLAAFLISFDGLSFAQSRIATRDALLVFLVTTSLYLILRNHRFFSALLAGFALAAKWTSLPLLPLLLFHRLTPQAGPPALEPQHVAVLIQHHLVGPQHIGSRGDAGHLQHIQEDVPSLLIPTGRADRHRLQARDLNQLVLGSLG